MFNVGGGEILVIALLALIVLGPQRLPGAARQVGKAMSELRRMSNSFQSELKSALDEDGPGSRPTREVKPLGSPSASAQDPSVTSALRSVGEQASPEGRPAEKPPPRARRTPLRAEPLPGGTTGEPSANGQHGDRSAS